MKLKVWLGIVLLISLGFVSGVACSLFVARSQVKQTFLGEKTLLRSLVQRRAGRMLSLNEEGHELFDAFLTDAIVSLRLTHLPFEASVGRKIFSGMSSIIDKKPEEERENYRKLIIERYSQARQPTRGSLFLELHLSIQQIQEFETILIDHEGFETDSFSTVPEMMRALITYKKDDIMHILSEEQQELFGAWLSK